MKPLLLCSLLVLLGLQVQAATVLVDIGGTTYLDFQDGRKAVFSHALGKVIRVPIGLRQIENTCDTAQILANCHINIDFASQSQYLRWAVHPDPTKLGKIVQVRPIDPMTNLPGTELIPLEDKFQAYFWFDTVKNKQWANYFKADEISCDNYLWTDQMPRVNGHILIQSWTGEIMTSNPETGANENQSLGGVFNVELTQTPAKSLVFAKFGPAHQSDNTPPYLSDQVSNITFEGPQHQQCQVSFEVDLQLVTKALTDATFRDVVPGTELPLTMASELGRFGQVKYFVMDLLRPGSSTEAE